MRRPVGSHVPFTGGLAASSLRYAEAVGAEAIQVFAANPRGWALPACDPAQDELLGAEASRRGWPVFVHAPYLVNLASPDPGTRDRSAAAVRYCLERGARLGARGVIMHAGSSVGAPRDGALRQVRELVLPMLEAVPEGGAGRGPGQGPGPGLLIEPMAGQGTMLCSRPAELHGYLAALDWHPRAGVCLDTCHVFAAGHDLTAPDGVAALLDALADAGAGGGRLALIHANDSLDGCGSHHDRHETIGAGKIGTGPFRDLLHHPATAGVPFIAETPGGEKGHARDIALLRSLRDSDKRATSGRQNA
ncbi:MAG TPA: deoxyribonuclease IV [Streptosporangiaceae bacterium]